MKKKQTPKKLTLKIETVRELETGQLQDAIGGSIGSCVDTACPRVSCWC